jgi:hypothetical protein
MVDLSPLDELVPSCLIVQYYRFSHRSATAMITQIHTLSCDVDIRYKFARKLYTSFGFPFSSLRPPLEKADSFIQHDCSSLASVDTKTVKADNLTSLEFGSYISSFLVFLPSSSSFSF